MRLRDFGLHVKIMSGGGEAVNDSSHDSDCSRHCWGVRQTRIRFLSAEKCKGFRVYKKGNAPV